MVDYARLPYVIAAGGGLGGLYLGYTYLQDYLEVERIRKMHKTEEPYTYPDSGFLGIRGYRELMKTLKAKRAQEASVERFEEVGDTYASTMFGRTVVDTRDPENIKAILATQFDQYYLGKGREDSFNPFLGQGIFTHIYGGGPKGAPWRHSRSMLRPQFARQQIQDLDVAEHFVQNLIGRIPSNETFDLQELFFKFTIDTGKIFVVVCSGFPFPGI